MAGLGVLSTLVLAGCGSTASPASPTAGAGAPAGAIINGLVRGVSSGAKLTTASRVPADKTAGLTVTVNGTTIGTAVDGTGRFTLTGVPGGTAQLHFTGNGIDATLTLSGLTAQDTITLEVTLNGRDARVDRDERHNGDGGDEVEGTITALDATARTITVGPRIIAVPSTVPIRNGRVALAFADLKVGQRVEVHGTMSGTTFTATDVKLDDEEDDD
jgi:hypothetical protein